MNTIRLHVAAGAWHATYSGPHAAEIVALFGSATIPTAFTDRAPLATVREALRARNPGVTIVATVLVAADALGG
jgi:hypothetical protein